MTLQNLPSSQNHPFALPRGSALPTIEIISARLTNTVPDAQYEVVWSSMALLIRNITQGWCVGACVKREH